MGGIKYSVHPLFFAIGFYYALTGRIFIFLVYTFTAVLHETGHSIAAARAGYRLNRITLTPFGAVVSGNIEGLKFYDAIIIAAAGPLVNLAVGLSFVAVWWIFPETYAFTDVAAEANFTLAVVNCIPAYPLDGGRILSALLSIKFGSRRAYAVSRIAGVALAVMLCGAFVVTLFYTPNPSILFFGLFVFVGALTRKKENVYVRVNSVLSAENLRRGVPVKKLAVAKDVTLKTLVRIIDPVSVNEIDVYDGEKVIKKLNQKQIADILCRGNLYSALEKYL